MVWVVLAVIAAAVIVVDRLITGNRKLNQILAEERDRRNDEDASDAHPWEPWGEPS